MHAHSLLPWLKPSCSWRASTQEHSAPRYCCLGMYSATPGPARRPALRTALPLIVLYDGTAGAGSATHVPLSRPPADRVPCH